MKSEQFNSQQIMTEHELESLGGGFVAYIKELTVKEVKRKFPAVAESLPKKLPKGAKLFSLHAADGTQLALTDTRQAAVGRATDDDLEIATVH
jgi:hypothetical protein